MEGGSHSTVMVELVLLIVVRSPTNSGTNIKNDVVILIHVFACMNRVWMRVWGGIPIII